jgi:hypothetical protein
MVQRRRLVACIVVIAAALPYVPTWNDYFIQDDFGVVGLLSTKPAGYFPRWFVTSWMDDIWGFTPDEIRPFVAPTYQIAAVWGAASPVANHVINIGLHAGNALLVFKLAEMAAGLSVAPALFTALVFALLPMQTESVAWVTGRVDTLPAFFYLASFLLFARWRDTGRSSTYAWSVTACFAALFAKQNAVTLLPALVLYDVVSARRAGSLRRWLWPYLPYAGLTIGYLWLRYELFGEVARESTLSGERFQFFLQDLSTHLRRMVFGEPGVKLSEMRSAAIVGVAAMFLAAIGLVSGAPSRAQTQRRALLLAVGWIVLGAAPTLVAGYASPRHMYLASVGWAMALGVGLDVLLHARPLHVLRRLGLVLAGVILVSYAVQLRHQVRVWGIRAAVSRRVVADIEREALAAPAGSLIITDAPQRSWNFALPYALRPPFTEEDIPSRVSVISHSSIHCCPASQWEAYTRAAMRGWASNPDHPWVIALHWDPDTGELSRVSDREDPFLRSVVSLLQETKDVDSLDNRILEIMRKLVAGRKG